MIFLIIILSVLITAALVGLFIAYYIVFFSGYIEGGQKRVGSAGGLSVVCQGADQYGRHGEEERGLIEVVDGSQLSEG